ncbi:YDG/SRA domain-containing protein [Mucilaginibacter sabulilitoris]|uniref:YDG/SRA domain-containing protein n=1 Tax=Mucilaginibacter sabulilitoris TaxID=1173583 RepID=A0ABZ0TEA5_9SPHI|nr:YDG/SRA domain-containing protein [Mucilaginibacter sabulilitoris]WPU91530.1 YDG/SRA domain-containing protein [Mucilaginibacter sabulilitoris]
MTTYIFGALPDLEEGDIFPNRKALTEAGIHKVLMGGIDGNPRQGASSIVLNGGYVDDFDLGDEIIYTGHGGNDPNTGRQIKDQSWESPGNKALLVSELHALPVRVTRGYKHHSAFSPKSGFVYGGLYQVTEHFEDRGKDGFLICRYRLQKIQPGSTMPPEPIQSLPAGNEDSKRQTSTVLRIVRDTKLSRELKALYDYTCQICGLRITIKGIGYAEAAHIKPLGKPHNGFDKADNLLCLCPNHHVMLDKGILTLTDEFEVLGGEYEKVTFKADHALDGENIRYHRAHIFINE